VTKASFLIDLKFYAVDVKEDAIVEQLDAAHFSKYVPLVNGVMKSLERDRNILEDCLTILSEFRLNLQQDENMLYIESLERWGRSFKYCNEHLRKVGLRVENEVQSSPYGSSPVKYKVSLSFLK
jgi:hypothetical protein